MDSQKGHRIHSTSRGKKGSCCGCCVARCSSKYFNDKFAYTTAKVVRIHDSKLGLLNFALIVLIFAYVCVYNIAYSNQAFMYETPQGAVRFSAQEPTVDGCDPTSDPECILDLTPQTELMYCNESAGTRAFKKFPCIYLSAEEMMTVFDSSAMLTTRTKNATWERACNREASTCKKIWNIGNETETFFVADVERYTLMIDHSAQAPTLDVKGEGFEIAGRLLSRNATQCAVRGDATSDLDGNDKTDSQPCYLAPGRPPFSHGAQLLYDVFSIETLLHAANLDIDEASFGDHSIRYRGCTLLMAIQYKNTWPWCRSSSNITYAYDITVLRNSQFEVEELTRVDDSDNRKYSVNHGIRIVVLMSGKFGEFSFSQFMLVMATSTWLLATAAMITEFCMLNVMDLKDVYGDLKVHETKNIAAIKNRRKKGLEAYVDNTGVLRFRWAVLVQKKARDARPLVKKTKRPTQFRVPADDQAEKRLRRVMRAQCEGVLLDTCNDVQVLYLPCRGRRLISTDPEAKHASYSPWQYGHAIWRADGVAALEFVWPGEGKHEPESLKHVDLRNLVNFIQGKNQQNSSGKSEIKRYVDAQLDKLQRKIEGAHDDDDDSDSGLDIGSDSDEVDGGASKADVAPPSAGSSLDAPLLQHV